MRLVPKLSLRVGKRVQSEAFYSNDVMYF